MAGLRSRHVSPQQPCDVRQREGAVDPPLLLRHLVDREAELDRDAQPLPQLVAVEVRQVGCIGLDQLVGDLAVRFDADVDQPRNLAKSVTVE